MKHVRFGEVPEPQGRVDYIGSQKEQKKPKKLRLLDIFMDSSTTTRVAAGMERIFINENITSYRRAQKSERHTQRSTYHQCLVN